ncbi:hypothetical protein H1R20_g806, partial [Candolleomyces eurysporus]
MEVDLDTMTDSRETPTPQQDPIPNDGFRCDDSPVRRYQVSPTTFTVANPLTRQTCEADIPAPPTTLRDSLAKTQEVFRRQELAGSLLPPTPEEKEVITSLCTKSVSIYLDGFCLASAELDCARQELEKARLRVERAKKRYMPVYRVTGKIIHCLREGELDEHAVQAVKDWDRRYPRLYEWAKEKTTGGISNQA